MHHKHQHHSQMRLSRWASSLVLALTWHRQYQHQQKGRLTNGLLCKTANLIPKPVQSSRDLLCQMQALGLSRISGLHLLALYSLVLNHKPRLLLRRVNSLQDDMLLIWREASSTAHVNVCLMLLMSEIYVAKKVSSMPEQCLGLPANYHLLTLQMMKGRLQATLQCVCILSVHVRISHMLHNYVDIYLLLKNAILLGQSMLIHFQHQLMLTVDELASPS